MPTHADVEERILEAEEHLAGGVPGVPRVWWLSGARSFPPRVLESFSRRGTPLLRTDCDRAFPIAFEPIRDLLRQLLPVVEREAPFLLVEFGPEILALLPEYRSRSYLRSLLPLNQIALGGTKRRIHKDSEVLFRIVYAFASLFLEARANCPSLGSRPIVLAVSSFDAADRLTLSCLYHLAQRIGPAKLLLVLAGMSPDAPDRTAGWLWGEGGGEGLSPEAARLTDGFASHRNLVQKVLESLVPSRLEASSTSAQAGPTSQVPDACLARNRLLALGCRGPLLDRVLERLGANGQASPPGGWEPLSGADLARIRRELPAGDRRRLHELLAEELAGESGPDEGRVVPLAYHRLRSGEVGSGIEAAFQGIELGFGYSMNFEGILLLAREVLRHTEGRKTAFDRAREVAAWQVVGLAQTYIEDIEKALEAFQIAHDRSESPEVRAQTCYYIGLVRSKRCAGDQSGGLWFQRGLSELEGLSSPEAILERGWLHNGLGLVAWREKRFGEGHDMVDAALEFTEALSSDPQIANLRVNLINNSSVLYEEEGNVEQALATWRGLSNILDEGGGGVTKSFYYRESWMLLKLGRIEEALASATHAFRIAEEVRDFFHMDIISRACGYLASRAARLEEAQYWFQYNLNLRQKLDDHRNIPAAWAALGHLAVQAGAVEAGAEAFRAAAQAARAVEDSERALVYERAAVRLEGGGDLPQLGADDLFEGVGLERPKAKLTSPFSLGHLSSASSFVPEVHRSVLGGASAPSGGNA